MYNTVDTKFYKLYFKSGIVIFPLIESQLLLSTIVKYCESILRVKIYEKSFKKKKY